MEHNVCLLLNVYNAKKYNIRCFFTNIMIKLIYTLVIQLSEVVSGRNRER